MCPSTSVCTMPCWTSLSNAACAAPRRRDRFVPVSSCMRRSRCSSALARWVEVVLVARLVPRVSPRLPEWDPLRPRSRPTVGVRRRGGLVRRRTRRVHSRAGSGAPRSHHSAADRDRPPGQGLSIPGLHLQRIHRRAPHQALGRGRDNRFGKPSDALWPTPQRGPRASGGAWPVTPTPRSGSRAPRAG